MECFGVDRVDLASIGVGDMLITSGVVVGDGSTLTIGKEHSIDDIDTVTLLELRNDIERCDNGFVQWSATQTKDAFFVDRP